MGAERLTSDASTALRLQASFSFPDGLTLTYDREVETFRILIGKLVIHAYRGQLIVSTAPGGSGSATLLSVDARP